MADSKEETFRAANNNYCHLQTNSSMNCLAHEKCRSQSPRRRPQMSRFVQQPKDIQFTVTEEERNQKLFTFKKLELENFDFFSLKKYSNR